MIHAAQLALRARGFDPGPVDGIAGPKTRAATRAFQKGQELPVSGILDAVTVRRLGIQAMTEPVWMTEAKRRRGLHEVRDKHTLREWLAWGGRTLGDPAEFPWCGDFVETAITRTLPDEPLPANPYAARSWLRFGHRTQRSYGAVCVFWRGAPTGWQGHVAFYLCESRDAIRVLGGNQTNAVTEAWVAKDRLIDSRWPATVAPPATGPIVVSRRGGLSDNER